MQDPIARFGELHARVLADDTIAEPWAAVLATADADGRPSARVVLVREVSDAGWCFFTNYGSRKARELDANPFGALCFYWGQLTAQVRVEGRVERTTVEESAAYFARRARGSQVGAWASRQSEPLDSMETLADAVARAEARFEGQDVPCPPFWGGFRLVPTQIELWNGRAHRLHEREIFRPDGAGGWTLERQYP